MSENKLTDKEFEEARCSSAIIDAIESFNLSNNDVIKVLNEIIESINTGQFTNE